MLVVTQEFTNPKYVLVLHNYQQLLGNNIDREAIFSRGLIFYKMSSSLKN